MYKYLRRYRSIKVRDARLLMTPRLKSLAKYDTNWQKSGRIALASTDVFLQLNGYELTASEVDATSTILDLAAGEINEEQLAEWIRGNSQAFSG